MSAPTFRERLVIAQQTARWSMANASSRLVAAPGLGWRLLKARADQLLFIPSDMRPVDPSLVEEIAAGQMGLGGVVMELAGGSPFALTGPDRGWARVLNGFSWLGSFRASADPTAVDTARRLVADWCRRNKRRSGGHGIAAEPEVIARRVTSFVVNAGFLLEDADAEFYRMYTRALAGELRALDAASRRAAPGYPSLICAMAVTLVCLATNGNERDLPAAEARLLTQLRQQILADGGHATRNPEIVLELLLDLLPIRQCYAARGLGAPIELVTAIDRMLRHLRVMTIGPGTLARFNGVGAARVEAVATALAVEAVPSQPATQAPGSSGYARLQRGETVVIVDCGRPPGLLQSGLAHAGALSFEMAHGGAGVVVNSGAPGPDHRRAIADARATASHSTLVVDEQSSARLVRSTRLERLLGGLALAGPDSVTASFLEVEGDARLVTQHDGYLTRFGLLHERQLNLREDGYLLEGVDRLRPPHGTLRLPRDLPIAVHFHLPVEARWRTETSGSITIMPAEGPHWRMTVSGARCSVETSTDYAQSQGPTASRQIVARSSTPGETTITWRLERI